MLPPTGERSEDFIGGKLAKAVGSVRNSVRQVPYLPRPYRGACLLCLGQCNRHAGAKPMRSGLNAGPDSRQEHIGTTPTTEMLRGIWVRLLIDPRIESAKE